MVTDIQTKLIGPLVNGLCVGIASAQVCNKVAMTLHWSYSDNGETGPSLH